MRNPTPPRRDSPCPYPIKSLRNFMGTPSRSDKLFVTRAANFLLTFRCGRAGRGSARACILLRTWRFAFATRFQVHRQFTPQNSLHLHTFLYFVTSSLIFWGPRAALLRAQKIYASQFTFTKKFSFGSRMFIVRYFLRLGGGGLCPLLTQPGSVLLRGPRKIT